MPVFRIKSLTKQTLTLSLVIACSLGSSACSWFQFPGVYRLTVQQGNIVSQEMVDQLKPGMTKRQVNFVLGTPLITDSFNQNRWDYYYSLRDPHGDIQSQRLAVYFNAEERMTHFDGTDVSAAPIVPTHAEPAETLPSDTNSPGAVPTDTLPSDAPTT